MYTEEELREFLVKANAAPTRLIDYQIEISLHGGKRGTLVTGETRLDEIFMGDLLIYDCTGLYVIAVMIGGRIVFDRRMSDSPDPVAKIGDDGRTARITLDSKTPIAKIGQSFVVVVEILREDFGHALVGVFGKAAV